MYEDLRVFPYLVHSYNALQQQSLLKDLTLKPIPSLNPRSNTKPNPKPKYNQKPNHNPNPNHIIDEIKTQR